MIILPLDHDAPDSAQTELFLPAPHQETVRLLVMGFTPAERELIQGITALSQRRHLRIELSGAQHMKEADVILLDGTDLQVMAWVARGRMPGGKVVIQVDGQPVPGHIPLQRPIQWPSLPALLQQTLGIEASRTAGASSCAPPKGALRPLRSHPAPRVAAQRVRCRS